MTASKSQKAPAEPLTPPKYENKHRWDDTANTVAAHTPSFLTKTCLCEVPVENAAEWADHLTAVLLGPRP